MSENKIRVHKNWTPEEIALIKGGKTVEEISTITGRSLNSIIAKMWRIENNVRLQARERQRKSREARKLANQAAQAEQRDLKSVGVKNMNLDLKQAKNVSFNFETKTLNVEF